LPGKGIFRAIFQKNRIGVLHKVQILRKLQQLNIFFTRLRPVRKLPGKGVGCSAHSI
jgi:hypothetical protein